MAFAHLHTHTEYSALDGLSTVAEVVAQAAADGNPAVAITDHGNCAGHPEHQQECDKAGIKPVFGMEGYFVPDRTLRPAPADKTAQQALRDNRHLVMLAMDDQGLHDLWAASTEASVSGFYHKPRLDYELLERYGSRLIVTSGCLGGLVSRQLLSSNFEGAFQRITRLREILGDRFYLELQTNALPEQVKLNKMLASISDGMGIPLVAAADSHFTTADKTDTHRLWMACQTSPANDDFWHYVHMHTEQETRQALAYLGPEVADRSVRNAAEIAEMCNARIGGHADPPVFTSSARQDASMLLDLCMEAWAARPMKSAPARVYLDRLESEWKLVAEKQLAGCYLIVNDVCQWARSQGILVGFRGSAAGSLMAYLLRITSVDPVQHGLMFERFVTPGRTSLPDFDMDFPSSARDMIQDYVIGKYGADKVVRVGTHLRYRSKGVLNKLFSIMGDKLPQEWFDDSRQIASIIDEAESHTAGLGMPWDELMEQQEELLAPYVAKYPGIFGYASQLVGRLNSYGKHPAGLVISTSRPLEGQLPMRAGEGGILISQWGYRTLDILGMLKLDFLTIRTLDSVQMAVNLIRERTGAEIDVSAWDGEYDDPLVWDEVGSGHTLGMFQVETSLGQQGCRRMRPRSIADLADLVALVRPGPRNSGMAESYYRRRAGTEEVDFLHERLEETLSSRFGIMLFQEDVMAACRLLAGYDSAEADEVRQILGKKKVEKIGPAGEKFVSRCISNGVDQEKAQEIWDKMAEYARYGFNKSHSVSYAVLAFQTAWLKAHYPVETFTAILSTLKDKDRMPEYATDARRMGLTILPPDARFCGGSFLPEGLGVRYGLSSIKGIGPAALRDIQAGQPYSSYDDFITRSKVDSGVLYALARSGALDALVISRRGVVQALEADRTGESTKCVHKEDGFSGPGGLPCHFNWSTEPVPIRISEKTGRELKSKPKPLPRRCTRACRHYTPPGVTDLSMIPEYSPQDLFRLDSEIFGCWMSDSVFGLMERFGAGTRAQARDIALMLPGAQPGSYPMLAVAGGAHAARTRKGGTMYWLSLVSEVSSLDVAVFQPRRDDEPDLTTAVRFLRPGSLVLATVRKSRYFQDGTARTSWRLDDILLMGG
jgi:DNA polymerase-3 subunit alpha